MTLYTQRSRNIAKTWLLMSVFFGIVIAAGWVMAQAYQNPGILYVAVFFSIFMNFTSYWFSDKIVLGLHRARPVDFNANRDMLVSTVAVVLVGFIAILSDMFTRSMLFRGLGGDNDRGKAGGIILLFGLIISILAPIVAQLLHFAISRRREFLADTSGALLTRYPEGLARALKKIGVYSRPLRTASNATAHLFLENPFGADRDTGQKTPWIVRIFSTHPPVEERIQALLGMQVEK